MEICFPTAKANLNPFKRVENCEHLLEEFKQKAKGRNKKGLRDYTSANTAAPLVTRMSEGKPAMFSRLPPR